MPEHGNFFVFFFRGRVDMARGAPPEAVLSVVAHGGHRFATMRVRGAPALLRRHLQGVGVVAASRQQAQGAAGEFQSARAS